jgi:uncharacterized protein YggT (Ycf19 family)
MARRIILALALILIGALITIGMVWVPIARRDWNRGVGTWTSPPSRLFRTVSPSGRVLRVQVTEIALLEEWVLDPPITPLPPLQGSGGSSVG